MLDVRFPRPPNFTSQFRQILVELLPVCIKARIEIAVPITKLPHLVGPASSEGDFHMFCAPHHQSPQNAVEIIKGRHIIERDAALESRARSVLWMLKIQPVGAQAIIADMAQPITGAIFVLDRHPLCTEMVDLLIDCQRGFGVDAGHAANLVQAKPVYARG